MMPEQERRRQSCPCENDQRKALGEKDRPHFHGHDARASSGASSSVRCCCCCYAHAAEDEGGCWCLLRATSVEKSGPHSGSSA